MEAALHQATGEGAWRKHLSTSPQSPAMVSPGPSFLHLCTRCLHSPLDTQRLHHFHDRYSQDRDHGSFQSPSHYSSSGLSQGWAFSNSYCPRQNSLISGQSELIYCQLTQTYFTDSGTEEGKKEHRTKHFRKCLSSPFPSL